MKATKIEGANEVKEIIQEIIDSSRPDLAECKVAIIESSRMPAASPVKVSRAGHVAEAIGFDLTLVYSGPVFLSIEPKRQEMLIANAIADWIGVEKEGRDSQPKYWEYKKKPALKIHPEILEKYGNELPEHAVVLEAAAKQLSLPLVDSDTVPADIEPKPRRRKRVDKIERSEKVVALS